MRVVVTNYVTLDGVMQSPGHADEDRSGGFGQGGWAPPYADQVMGARMGEGIDAGGSMLFGRRTYEKMAAAWSDQPDDNVFAEVLNNRPKYVASRTLSEPLGWANSTLLEGDAADAVAELRRRPGKDIAVLGSGELVRGLRRRNLIDEFVLCIHPLLLGAGRRMFADGDPFAKLELVDAKPTTTGVILATYRPAEPAPEPAA